MSSLSSLRKKLKITRKFGLADALRDVGELFNGLRLIGRNPGLFQWDEDRTENQQADDYTEYIRDKFLGSRYLRGNIVENVHMDKNYLNTSHLNGGCDVSIYKETKAPFHKQGIRIVIEVKKARLV